MHPCQALNLPFNMPRQYLIIIRSLSPRYVLAALDCRPPSLLENLVRGQIPTEALNRRGHSDSPQLEAALELVRVSLVVIRPSTSTPQCASFAGLMHKMVFRVS